MRAVDIVDADTHLYEPEDCFTRYLDPCYLPRCLHVQTDAGGIRRWHFGDRPTSFVPDAIDTAHGPGAGEILFDSSTDPSAVSRVSTDLPVFADPSARLDWMIDAGVAAAVVLPNIGLVADYEMRTDPEAMTANLLSYNRWLESTWGFAVDGRLFAVPLLPLENPGAAAAEAERLIEAGARMVLGRTGVWGGLPPGHPSFDRLWDVLSRARTPLMLHIAHPGYTAGVGAMWGVDPDPADTELTPLHVLACFGARPLEDTIVSMAQWGVFDRWSNLTVVSAENGSSFVSRLMKLEPFFSDYRRRMREDPAGRSIPAPDDSLTALLRRHLSVIPSPFDDPSALAKSLGSDRVLFGSDFPHPEGVERPAHALGRLSHLDDDLWERYFRANAAALLGLGT